MTPVPACYAVCGGVPPSHFDSSTNICGRVLPPETCLSLGALASFAREIAGVEFIPPSRHHLEDPADESALIFRNGFTDELPIAVFRTRWRFGPAET